MELISPEFWDEIGVIRNVYQCTYSSYFLSIKLNYIEYIGVEK